MAPAGKTKVVVSLLCTILSTCLFAKPVTVDQVKKVARTFSKRRICDFMRSISLLQKG
jgi:hypothetical protein